MQPQQTALVVSWTPPHRSPKTLSFQHQVLCGLPIQTGIAREAALVSKAFLVMLTYHLAWMHHRNS